MAMRRTIYIGGAAGLLITAALILAQPDFDAILSGEQADPVGAVLSDVFGSVGSKIITVIVLISFVSCVPQPAGRGEPADLLLRARPDGVRARRAVALLATRHVPPVALIVAAVLPAMIVAIAEVISDSALLKVISFAAAGIYIAFQLVVLAALIARSRGWVPRGKFTLGAGAAGQHRRARSTASAARSTSRGRAAATRSPGRTSGSS